MGLSRPWWPWACAAVTVFAAVFVWFAGHRGVFLLDQSIMFDGALRVYQGQVQYRDFVSTFPPLTFGIQALFFRLMGVDFSAMVLAAAVSNAIYDATGARLTQREAVAAVRDRHGTALTG